MFNITEFNEELATNSRSMEIDFDKMTKVADVLNDVVEITDFTRITTEYGNKMVVKLANETFMYVNDICAEQIEKCESYLPMEFYFKKKLKKSAQLKDESKLKDTDYYITCYPQTKRASVKDYLNKEITVISMREVETDYGTKYAVILDDYTEFLTSWSKLYNIFDKHRDTIRESGGITGIWVVEKESRNGNKYCGFSEVPPEEKTSKVNKPVKNLKSKKKTAINRIKKSDLVDEDYADPDIAF